jgi:hypothetical protein
MEAVNQCKCYEDILVAEILKKKSFFHSSSILCGPSYEDMIKDKLFTIRLQS